MLLGLRSDARKLELRYSFIHGRLGDFFVVMAVEEGNIVSKLRRFRVQIAESRPCTTGREVARGRTRYILAALPTVVSNSM